MKKLLLLLLLMPSVAFAKTAREEIYENVAKAGNQYLVYQEPDTVKYTKAPKGYKPFYISAYIRHGSRFLIGEGDYTKPQRLLQVADSMGLLTEKGKYAKYVVDSVASLAKGRYGELTTVGYRQHQGIARRMYKNFPEVFADGSLVDARSTNVIRCIISMMSECNTLTAMNPDIKLFTDASFADMYYMNNMWSKYHKEYGHEEETKAAKAAFKERMIKSDRVIGELFTDYTTLDSTMKRDKFYRMLIEIALSMQSIDTELELMSLFTPEECYNTWAVSTFNWYTDHGFCPLSKNMKPYAQLNLLRNIISSADSAIANGTPAANLRFGHDGILLPLAALMHLDSVDYSTSNPDELLEHWRPYNYFPMACNIQIIFYKSKRADAPVLVKIMLNERECHLPLNPLNGVYYNWNDIKEFYLSTYKQFYE